MSIFTAADARNINKMAYYGHFLTIAEVVKKIKSKAAKNKFHCRFKVGLTADTVVYLRNHGFKVNNLTVLWEEEEKTTFKD